MQKKYLFAVSTLVVAWQKGQTSMKKDPLKQSQRFSLRTTLILNTLILENYPRLIKQKQKVVVLVEVVAVAVTLAV